MPPRLRLELERSLEISSARLSSQIGCGLMLEDLPRYKSSDALVSIMENYGCNRIAADKLAQKILENQTLLKAFHENAFIQKMPIRDNFRTVYGERDIWLAFDLRAKAAWFISEGHNRIALTNYHRDTLQFVLKSHGIILVGAMVRLSAVGWQNLCELVTDDFFDKHRAIQRIEVMGVLSGVRWRPPTLGLGTFFLNVKEPEHIRTAAETVLRKKDGGEIEG